jgi:hypothetical protein
MFRLLHLRELPGQIGAGPAQRARGATLFGLAARRSALETARASNASNVVLMKSWNPSMLASAARVAPGRRSGSSTIL